MNKQKALEGLLAAAGFAAALFLFVPSVVYLLNLTSVATPKMTILQCGGLFAIFATAVLGLFSFIPRVGRWVAVICQIGLIALVILTIFPNKTGELTGFTTHFSSFQNLWAVAKGLVIISGGVWLARKKPQLLASLSRYCLIVVILVVGYVAVGKTSAVDKAASLLLKKGESRPSESFTRLGAANNVIVVIFDCFTGYRMPEILQEVPSLREDLSGFVYYPNAIASALSTPAGVSAIITGDLKVSLNDVDTSVRNVDSLKSSFLADAQQIGLNTGFISSLGSGGVEIPCTPETSFFAQKSLNLLNRLPAYVGFMTTSLTRVMPRSLCDAVAAGAKQITRVSQKAAKNDWDLLQTLQGEMTRRPQTSKMALNYFIDNLQAGAKKGSVIVLHSYLTHPPYHLAADGHYMIDIEEKDYEKRGYDTSIYAASELARLCNKLKSLGVLDSTLIIAVGDHGTLPIRDKSMGGVVGKSGDVVNFNPLLMVKAPGAQGTIRASAMSVWLGDVAATVRDFLGIQDNSDSLVTTYSLLKPEMQNRKLNVPIFIRQDQVSHYSSLAKWIRQDMNGTFRDYVALITEPPLSKLRTRAQVKLFSGRDHYQNELTKAGWGKTGIQYRAAIEVNERLVAKLSKPGIAVVTETGNEYRTKKFTDFYEAEAFLKVIPTGRDCLMVGLQVPADLAARLFPQEAAAVDPKKVISFVAASGPSYGPNLKTVMGSDDVSLDIKWKQ